MVFLPIVTALTIGCSYFAIKSEDGFDVLGRSMEANGWVPLPKEDYPYNWLIVKAPNGVVFNSTNDVARSSDCRNLATTGWETKHAWVGIGYNDDFGRVSDGINVLGLSIQAHTFRGSKYMSAQDPSNSLCYNDFTTWVLSSFATVAEMLVELKTMRVVSLPDISTSGQLHWQVTDAIGGSVVIEYIDGELKAHNNTVKVMTNDPSFGWHLENLNNFVPISTDWPDRSKIAVPSEIGMVPLEISHGINLLGLPGDASPPGRFVRMFYIKQFAQLNSPATNVSQAIELASSILNTVYIPKGICAHKNHLSDGTSDFTEYTTLKLPQKRQYLIRTYSNTQWRLVDLTKMQWGSKLTQQKLHTPGDMGIKDITGEVL
eukprot:TRINITY_DN14951_c0_g3_i1.p1 TRINITY_DN14951_c0_g3~~TRINITY_DN14951_c0_g3_i1.p1  ORF type:complete len:374 (+),score=33.97 TRINITY_DN14951_c0_g3_i1:38-1159(+)